MRDRWASYDSYRCAQSICGAHLVRDCLSVAEQEQQEWAGEIADLLVSMARAAEEWRQRGVAAVQDCECDGWVAHYARPGGQQLCGPTAALRRRGAQGECAAQAECR